MSQHDKSTVVIFTPYFILPSELCCLASNFRLIRNDDGCTIYAVGYYGLLLEFYIGFDELRNILYFRGLEFNFHRSMGASVLASSWKLRHLRHFDELVATPVDRPPLSSDLVVTISVISDLPASDLECGSSHVCRCVVKLYASPNPGESYLNFQFLVTSLFSNPRGTEDRIIFDLLCPVHRGRLVWGSKEYPLTTDFSYLHSKRTNQYTLVAGTIPDAYDLILQQITAFLLHHHIASHVVGPSSNRFSDWARIARDYFKSNFDFRACREI